jgi:hypothetical protein
MDHYSYLIYMPYRLLLIGIAFILLAVISAFAGACPTRGGVAYRAKDPKTFWWCIAIYVLAGVCFIGDFLSKVN